MSKQASGEQGFALVALLAVLTILLVTMSLAAPAIKHDLQREQEEEMFWRGQQVAAALIKHARLKGRFPTELKDLVEKFETPQGTMRLLRPTALCDPLTRCEGGETNWREVRPGDPLISEFYQAYIAEMTRNPERRLPPPPQELAQMAQLAGGTISGLNPAGVQGGPSTSEFSKIKTELGPIYGVVSKDERTLIRNYFEIGTYDHALFFAGVIVNIPGIFSPLVFAPAQGASSIDGRKQDARCPNGGVYFEQDGKGYCGGVVNPGRLCRGPDGTTVPCPDAPPKK